jgi:hypothetical protein
METFDLIEYQQKARETTDPKKLFELWEDCCRRYERAEIGRYELDEMKDVIWPNLQALASIKRIINEMPADVPRSKKRKIS